MLKIIMGKDSHVAMADGSTVIVKKDSIKLKTLQELMTKDGGEVVSDDWRRQ